ncbi:hypothetical protein LSG31_01295 [Fodinisporobacter ferrooxydans]|uniref:Uncharacterized protein n=1 Tax=Fodinisporobacter ferrooxydans TaxID=2901836 RepID=A0ABY4CNC6_9BACL|nr:hypothetical protein LSG31_01295 [Alicyclobacillaceae bacterium MYW30-H2]
MSTSHPLFISFIGTLFIWLFFSELPYSFAVAINTFFLCYSVLFFHKNQMILPIGFLLAMIGIILSIRETFWFEFVGALILFLGLGIIVIRYEQVDFDTTGE